MSSETQRLLRDEFLQAMIESTFALQQKGPDRETTLEALVEAADVLKQRFEQELAALRQEEAD